MAWASCPIPAVTARSFSAGSNNGAKWYKQLPIQWLAPRAAKCPHRHARKGVHPLWSWCPGVLCGHYVWISCSITIKPSNFNLCHWCVHSTNTVLMQISPCVAKKPQDCHSPKGASWAPPGTEVSVFSLLSNTLRSFPNNSQGKSLFAHRLCKEPKVCSLPSFPILITAQFNYYI